MELKNDLAITGTLHSVDQYLNIKLNNIKVANPDKYPHMLSIVNCFIRGSVVRYIQASETGKKEGGGECAASARMEAAGPKGGHRRPTARATQRPMSFPSPGRRSPSPSDPLPPPQFPCSCHRGAWTSSCYTTPPGGKRGGVDCLPPKVLSAALCSQACVGPMFLTAGGGQAPL